MRRRGRHAPLPLLARWHTPMCFAAAAVCLMGVGGGLAKGFASAVELSGVHRPVAVATPPVLTGAVEPTPPRSGRLDIPSIGAPGAWDPAGVQPPDPAPEPVPYVAPEPEPAPVTWSGVTATATVTTPLPSAPTTPVPTTQPTTAPAGTTPPATTVPTTAPTTSVPVTTTVTEPAPTTEIPPAPIEETTTP